MTVKQSISRNKWHLDFHTRKNNDLSSPPGYNASALVSHVEVISDQRLVMKKSWDLALGPLKQIPMNLFIMYMSGKSISIFPIMMVGMLVVRSIKAIFSTHFTSKMAEGAQGVGQKFIYLLGNLANVTIAIYKCHSMGLLPTHASDWLAFVKPQIRREFFVGGVSLL